MNITERVIDSHEQEGVILEYVNFTKEFAEIKEYVRNKGQSWGILCKKSVFL